MRFLCIYGFSFLEVANKCKKLFNIWFWKLVIPFVGFYYILMSGKADVFGFAFDFTADLGDIEGILNLKLIINVLV